MKENKTDLGKEMFESMGIKVVDCTPKTEQIMYWEVEFDKLEVETWGTGRLKGYIKNLLSSQKQEYTNKLKEKIEGLKDNQKFIKTVKDQTLDTVLSIIKEI